MAKVEIKLRADLGRLEVGDIVVTALHGARLIVAGSDEFLAIDLEDGTVGARDVSLEHFRKNILCFNT